MQSNENENSHARELKSNSIGMSKDIKSNENSPTREIITNSIGFSKDLFNSKGK